MITRDVLADNGVAATNRDVLVGIRESLPAGGPTLECDEIASAWATLRIQGG